MSEDEVSLAEAVGRRGDERAAPAVPQLLGRRQTEGELQPLQLLRLPPRVVARAQPEALVRLPRLGTIDRPGVQVRIREEGRHRQTAARWKHAQIVDHLAPRLACGRVARPWDLLGRRAVGRALIGAEGGRRAVHGRRR
eukprot:scaffold95201_cov63-Phaeocystis_antarctica.AAC.1